MLNKEDARKKNGEDVTMVECERNLNPDSILKSKKGVCEHYAVLTAAMLRSVGIPCKMVKGAMKRSDGKTEGHAWITVNPKTGTLNMKALAAGTDKNDGWIRLDPTNMITAPKTTSNDDCYTMQYYG